MTYTPSQRQLSTASSLDELYPVLNANRMTAGWYKKRASLWAEPSTAFQPIHWRFDVGSLALDQAGRWMSTEQAERRNLLLFNPVGDNDYDTVRTLVAAYQMVKPGEQARAHRHSPNAMRLVVDAGPGCTTVVDGVELPMNTGDFLLTPGQSWHSHLNRGDANAYWIDFLDVPLVHLLEPMFVEHYPGGVQPVNDAPRSHPYYFRLSDVSSVLDATPPVAGVSRHRIDIAAAIRTMSVTYLRVAAGARLQPPRDTASRIFAVVSGRGEARIGEMSATWSRGDVLAVPSWTPFEFDASTDALLLEVSDEPVLQVLGFYRQADGAAR